MITIYITTIAMITGCPVMRAESTLADTGGKWETGNSQKCRFFGGQNLAKTAFYMGNYLAKRKHWHKRREITQSVITSLEMTHYHLDAISVRSHPHLSCRGVLLAAGAFNLSRRFMPIVLRFRCEV